VLGLPETQAVYFGVWITGILIGVVLMIIFAVFIGEGINAPRTQQTARENQGAIMASVVVTNGVVVQVDNWEKAAAKGDKAAEAELKAALGRGQANFNRICIGCHYGAPQMSSSGPYLGNLYETKTLFNGKPVNDANVVTFILLGSQSHNLLADGQHVLVNGGGGYSPMPAGIATPQQAVDIMLYLKQQTVNKP
jgi:mono/diheme cytochrome c family protein